MRTLSTWLSLCLLIYIQSCTPIYNVAYNYDKEADFTRLNTYDWLAKQSKVEIKKRIEKTVNTQLEVKGYRTATNNPDFLIDTQLKSRETWSRGMGGTRYRFEEEKLILQFIDAQSKKLLWRGEAMGMLNSNYTPGELNQLVNKAAQEILKGFPPSSAKRKTVQRSAPDTSLHKSAKGETIRTSARDITLEWNANAEPNLAGYKLYYKTGSSGPPYEGTGAAEGDSPIIIPLKGLTNPNSPQFKIHGLSETETYLFVITAYTTDGKESGYSGEVSITPAKIEERK